MEQSLAYSEVPLWEDYKTQRSHILPLWRHRYTLLSGIKPSGEVDAVSGATESHRFALDPYLEAGKGNEFVICVEINAPNDPDKRFRILCLDSHPYCTPAWSMSTVMNLIIFLILQVMEAEMHLKQVIFSMIWTSSAVPRK